MTKSLLRPVLFLGILFATCSSNGQGLFYDLPTDGSWATYDIQYTYRSKDVVDSGKLIITISSVGRVMTDSGANRWIEFYMQSPDRDTNKIWIRKLLIPERYLNLNNNPTSHVIRGWTKSAGETIIELAVPFHGQWPAYLPGPLNDQHKLSKKTIESGKGVFKCKGISGWIKYTDDRNHITKVTIETRLNKTPPLSELFQHICYMM